MKWNKNIFSGFLWIIAYVVSSITMAALASAFLEHAGLHRQEFRILLLCLLFAVEIILFFLVRSLILYFRPHEAKRGMVVYVFCLLFLIALAIVVRIGFFSVSGGTLAGDTSLLDVAKVTQNGIPLFHHNTTTLYVTLLSVLFSFLGNKPEMVVYFQIVLQCLSIAFFFLFARKSFGRIAALLTASILAFSPMFVSSLNVISPSILLCILCGALLWLYSGVLDYTGNRERCGVLCVFHFLITGLFAGGLAYLDTIGIVMIFAMLIGFFCLRYRCSIWGKIIQFVVFLIGIACGLMGLFYMESALCGGNFISIACSYFGELIKPVMVRLPSVTIDAQGFMLMCLMILVTFGMLGFFMQKYDKGIISIILFLEMTGFSIFGQLSIKEDDLWMIFFALVCGLGMQYFGDLWCYEDCVSRTLYLESESIVQTTELKTEETETEETETEETQSIRFIPNPLPVPKKHVHKELDFEREVQTDELKFDVDISDEDDFDIS